jgi:hypothetical protein
MEIAAGYRIKQQVAGGKHLRTAIGAYRGSLIKQIVLATLIGGVVSGALGITLAYVGMPEIGMSLMPGFSVAFLCIFGMFLPPVATQGAIAAERSWSMSLPFQLLGYFEVLSIEPQRMRGVTYDIIWRESTRPPDVHFLQSIIGAVDPEAQVVHMDARGARIMSGMISGFTGMRVKRGFVHRNHRFCKSIHGVVEQVLLPLHRTYPIAQVSLS